MKREGRRRTRPNSSVLWEGGHYYESKGPTLWSETGWRILDNLSKPHDGRLLFVDDVHPLDQVHPREQSLETVPFSPNPEPTHVLTESGTEKTALEILEHLKKLSKRKRARHTGRPRQWFCSGFPVTNTKGEPLCLLYDLGLTVQKQALGYNHAVNIVPSFYEREQRRLLRLVRKALPDFTLEVILFELDGTMRSIE